jgi:DNA-binding NarL/FixJ family response regulator
MMDPRPFVEALEAALGQTRASRGAPPTADASDVAPLVGLMAFFTYYLQRGKAEAQPLSAGELERAREAREEGDWIDILRPAFRRMAEERRAAHGKRPARKSTPGVRTARTITRDDCDILSLLADGLDPHAAATRLSLSYPEVLHQIQVLSEKLQSYAVPTDGEATWTERDLGPLRPVDEAPRAGIEPLTAREKEVLSFMAAGLDNRAIADRLVVSYPTIRSHVQKILDKLDAHSRMQAVARAYERGLLDR